MEESRRLAVARAGDPLIEGAAAAVEDSWLELLPAAAGWGPDSRRRARRAARAALQAILEVFAQGDLDDRSWAATRVAVFADGHADADEAAELLRSVRIVGVEYLADHLSNRGPLSHDDRWELHRRAAVFCDEILGVREEVSPKAIATLLSELHASGADLR